jgi:hypothetical protein
MAGAVGTLGRRYEVLRPHLNELQRRLWLGVEAAQLGTGGVVVVAEATGVAAATVRRGRAEVEGGEAADPGRFHKISGGRRRAEHHDSELIPALEALIAPTTRCDPMSLTPIGSQAANSSDLAHTGPILASMIPPNGPAAMRGQGAHRCRPGRRADRRGGPRLRPPRPATTRPPAIGFST